MLHRRDRAAGPKLPGREVAMALAALVAVAVGVTEPGPTARPAAAVAPVGTVALSAGISHTCALSEAGGILCWGLGSQGQLGNGAGTDSARPVPVSGFDSGAAAVAAGRFHSCGLTTGGSVSCWGRGSAGQLGNGLSVDTQVPVPVSGLSSGVVAIGAGFDHTCALLGTGSVRCWGSNFNGQLGDGTNTHSNTPVTVTDLDDAAQLSVGGFHTCVRTHAGAVRCWGRGDLGQLGTGGVSDATSPVTASGLGSGVREVAAGLNHTCAVRTAGDVRCWGDNFRGQLGIGTTAQANAPTWVVGVGEDVASLAAGVDHTCAVAKDRTARCWGSNDFGQLGTGTTTSSTTPVGVVELSDVTAISAGYVVTCASTTAAAVKCWGDSSSVPIGDGSAELNDEDVDGLLEPSTTPRDVALRAGVRAIDAGSLQTCALRDSGATSCWGRNPPGRLGDGTTTDSPVPVAVTGSSSATVVANGDVHTCGVEAGAARCWGEGANGRLGNGATGSSTVPVAVTGLSSGVVDIAAGTNHSCAVTVGGAASCWGHNDRGFLGDGTTDASSVPVAVTGQGSGIRAIFAGNQVSCSLSTAGAATCWGFGSRGMLGDGTTDDSSVPVAVTGLGSGTRAISIGSSHVCAVNSAGGVQCWGLNSGYGRLGTGDPADATTPQDVYGLSAGFVDVAAGTGHSCALRADGAVFCWGRNVAGELGDGTSDSSAVPVRVAGVDDATAIAIDGEHSCALTASGEAYCWGQSSFGRLGTGVTSGVFRTPQPVVGGATFYHEQWMPTAAVPSAPAAPVAMADDGRIALSWAPPADTGGVPLIGYVLRRFVDGATDADYPVGTPTARYDGAVVSGVRYSYAVAAVTDAGQGPFSPVSGEVRLAADGAVYVPVSPCRIVDTRQAGGALSNREIRDYVVAGSGAAFAAQGGLAGGCGIPEGASAVEASVTAVSPAVGGFFRAWPGDESMPNATFMNMSPGVDITNTGSIALASTGASDLKVRNFGGSSHYVIDVQGFYIDPAEMSGAVYVPVSPCRVVDTRQAGGALSNREIRSYQVGGSGGAFAGQGGQAGGCGIPEGASAVEASVTAVSPAVGGFFRAWPGDESMPNATFMNMSPGVDITNTGSIAMAASGTQDLTVRNFGGSSHYVIDVQGFYIDPAEMSGAVYVPVSPCRVVDTRQAGGAFSNREIRDYVVAGSGGAFAGQGGLAGGCGIPDGASAVEASVTAVSPAVGGFFRAWPGDESMPNATFMNMSPRVDITNTGSIAMAASGTDDLTVRNFGGSAHYVIDVQGYWVAQFPST